MAALDLLDQCRQGCQIIWTRERPTRRDLNENIGYGDACARIEATTLGLDIRFAVTNSTRLRRASLRRLQLADRLAAPIHDPRDPARVTHAMADIVRARIFAIACG
ncbi:hypothetical protein [Mesorhizobium sp. M1322]|uniref:hypothetical protein n=1 Tax=Mesorhizobium sp. M1322 TaxID=2957081 RepID=UPI0033356C6B